MQENIHQEVSQESVDYQQTTERVLTMLEEPYKERAGFSEPGYLVMVYTELKQVYEKNLHAAMPDAVKQKFADRLLPWIRVPLTEPSSFAERASLVNFFWQEFPKLHQDCAALVQIQANDLLSSLKKQREGKSGIEKIDMLDEHIRIVFAATAKLPLELRPFLTENLRLLRGELAASPDLSAYVSKWNREARSSATSITDADVQTAAEDKDKEQIYRTLGLKRLPSGALGFEAEGFLWEVTEELTDTVIAARAPDGTSMIASVETPRFFDLAEKKQLDTLVQEARKNYRSELAGKEFMETYDLPKEGSIAHFSVFSDHFDNGLNDPLTASMTQDVLLNAALRQRYGDRVQSEMLISQDPVKDLEDAIRRAHDAGTRHIMLDFYSHGEPKFIDFQKPLVAKDIIALVRRFPDCTFTVNTIACFGGGIFPEIAAVQDPDVQKRLALFTQTKPNRVNKAAVRHVEGEENWTFSNLGGTNYYLHLIEALFAGKTYGAAARAGDVAAKDLSKVDGSSLIDGQQISNGRLAVMKTA